MSRVLIAGTHSGCGKTTVTCAVLAALRGRGLAPAAFKCGPDYIDPMFHRAVLDVPSYHLDPFFFRPERLCGHLTAHGGEPDVLEGAMGYYDGVGTDGRFSAWSVAAATKTPAVLVVSAKGMYASAGAILKGFLEYRAASGIRGVIFNHTSPALYDGLSQIARRLGITPCGFLPPTPEAGLGSRHLGLVTAGEVAGLREKMARLSDLAERHIDLDRLLELAAAAPALTESVPAIQPLGHVRVAVARDEAFCFLYQENLDLLTALGCEPVFFSPLRDEALPENIGGLYLCGGYPELHLERLSQQQTMLRCVRASIEGGLPTIAECGGFLYLHDTVDGVPMAGVIHAGACGTGKLQRFGYVTLTAGTDNLLCRAGEAIPAHEFHYYDSTAPGGGFSAQKPLSDRRWNCIHATKTLYAGFPHLYLPANPVFAQNFVREALRYGN